MSQKISVAIIGANGYTGCELVRILLNHPHVHLSVITSRQYEGSAFSDIFPAFSGLTSLKFSALKIPEIARKVKAVFLCLPHHESMEVAKKFRAGGIKVIDLSADFRLKNPSVYEKWYGKHTQKNLLKEAVYGLPEFYRDEIKTAKLVASPGCYPTSIILGVAPLLKKRMIHAEGIICDSKSGVSGAGRSAKTEILFGEVNESFKAYNIGVHRHTPEIEQELSNLAGEKVKVLFSPHLAPMDRGILSTIYCRPIRKWSTRELISVYRKFYQNEKFVQILPEGQWPSTKNVRGSNMGQISLFFDERTEKIVVVSVIDNLTKGASGQAVQSFNLMHGFSENSGLVGLNWVP